ncbi:MAG: CHAD domain-containing protein, partial [Candidatus Eiseniibacteriota bacterium]
MDSPERETPDADHPESTIVERLEKSVAERIEAFAAAARRVRAGSDAEAIHDLRVATRRLWAALRVWRSLLPGPARRTAARRLRRLRRRIGRARELEVHVALLEARLPRCEAASRAAAAEILLRLKGRLARRRRAAARRVSPRRV